MGALEQLGSRLCAVAGACPPPVPAPAAVAFRRRPRRGRRGVTAWPSEITAQMVANFVRGGAAINVLARQAGATVTVVDVGVAGDLTGIDADPAVLRHAKVRGRHRQPRRWPRHGGRRRPCCPRGRRRLAADLVAAGAGPRHRRHGDRQHHPGRGRDRRPHRRAGREGRRLRRRCRRRRRARKVAVVDRALARLPAQADASPSSPRSVASRSPPSPGSSSVGSPARLPLVVDGVIAGAALLRPPRPFGTRRWPSLSDRRSPLRGTGCRRRAPPPSTSRRRARPRPPPTAGVQGALLAVPLVQSAARILAEVATFDSAGVSDK